MTAPNAAEVRKTREMAQRRKDIVKVVRRLIQRGGLDDVSLRKVAELAGFSTTVVYALFGDKATLIAQAMDQDFLLLAHAMAHAAQQHDAPLDRIRAMGRAYVHFGIAHPAEYEFAFMRRRPHAPNEASTIPHGDPESDPYALARSQWQLLAASGVVRGDDASIDLMAQIFWEGLHGLTARQLVMGEDDPWLPALDIDLHLNTLIEVMLSGISRQFSQR